MSHLQTLPDIEQETVGKGTRQRLAHSERRQLVRGDKGHRGSGAGRKEMEPPCRTHPVLSQSIITGPWEQNLCASRVLGSKGFRTSRRTGRIRGMQQSEKGVKGHKHHVSPCSAWSG